MKIVILAGGGGTRLWPVSRKTKPKQSQPLIGDRTLLEATYRRIRKAVPDKDIFISTNYKLYPALKRQVPELKRGNFILETEKRDTAAAIGLAAARLAKIDPQETMIMANADHYIKDVREYSRLLKLADRMVQQHPSYTFVIGIRPTYPETGYGYIKINKVFEQIGNDEIFYGQRFVEKPDLTTAKKYVRSWDYLWNSGIFCWHVEQLHALFRQHLPQHYAIMKRLQPILGTSREKQAVQREYKKFKSISIDYGIMEKTKHIAVIPASFDWADVGNWRTVKDILARRETDNVERGTIVSIDSRDNLLYSYSGKLIATAGLENMIVIETDDALLVCPKDRAQDVKKIVETLDKKKKNKYL